MKMFILVLLGLVGTGVAGFTISKARAKKRRRYIRQMPIEDLYRLYRCGSYEI